MTGVSPYFHVQSRRHMLTSSDPLTYEQLFKDGFPYGHSWMATQDGDNQLLLAKTKHLAIQKSLKRALDDEEVSEQGDVKKTKTSKGDSST